MNEKSQERKDACVRRAEVDGLLAAVTAGLAVITCGPGLLLPCWAGVVLPLVVGALFGLWSYRLHSSDDDDPLRCRKCEYSLRGLTEPRCPECGTPFDPRVLEEDTEEDKPP